MVESGKCFGGCRDPVEEEEDGGRGKEALSVVEKGVGEPDG